jgi:hypothetical protein
VTRVRLVGVLLLTAAALSGCGSGSGGPTGPGSTAGPPSTTAPPPRTSTVTATGTLSKTPQHRRHHRPAPRGPKAPAGPPVGHAQDVITHGSHLTVTIDQVLALPDPGTALLPGTRAVGVQVTIDNHGPDTYDSTASGDWSVVVSHGQSAPLDVRSGPCETQLQDFESAIYTGAVREGCVGFSVPKDARVIAARFSPDSRPPGTLTWRTAG